jgi:hypothetical protein
MQSVEFQSVIEDGTIRIPAQYTQYLTGVVKVTIAPMNIGKIKYARRAGPGELSPDDFSALKINTIGWKFNREEANERR